MAATPGTGWEIDVLFAGDFSTVLGRISNWESLSASKVLSDLGAGVVGLPLDDPTLGVPLPPGVTSTTQVQSFGTYPDPLTRSDALVWRTNTTPGTQKGFVDVGGATQYIRAGFTGSYSGTGKNIRTYLWYADDSNCVVIDWSRLTSTSSQTKMWLVRDGVWNQLATATESTQRYSNTVNTPTAIMRAYAYYNPITGSGRIDAQFTYDAEGAGIFAYTFNGLTNATWSGWTWGTKVGYDTTVASHGNDGSSALSAAAGLNIYTGSGVFNSGTNDEEHAQFLAYGYRDALAFNWTPDLGVFPTLDAQWYTGIGYRDERAKSYRRSPMEIVGNKFRPGWHPWDTLGGSQALIDINTDTGTWQAKVASEDGTIGAAPDVGLVIHSNLDGTACILIKPQNASPGYALEKWKVNDNTLYGADTTYAGGAGAQTWVSGDILRVDMQGQRFQIYRNSTLLADLGDAQNPSSTIVGVAARWKSYNGKQTFSPMESTPFGESGYVAFTLDDPTYIGTTTVSVASIPVDLLADENVWVVKKDGDTIFAFLAEQVAETVLGDDERKTVQVSGRGIGAVLEWGKVFPPAWPTPVTADHVYTGVVSWAAWLLLLQEAQNRGALTFVTPTFTATADTNGTPWVNLSDLTISPGDDLLSMLTRFAALDDADWQARLDTTTGTVYVDVWQVHGTDRSSTVVFWPGGDVTQQGRMRDRVQVANYVGGAGANSEGPGLYAFAQSAGSIGKWRHREVWVDLGDAASQAQVNAGVTAALREVGNEYKTLQCQVIPDKPTRAMFVDFDVGDSVGVRTDDVNMSGTYRVVALTVGSGSDEKVQGEITLNSKRDVRLLRLSALLSRLGGSNIGPTVASRL